MTAPTPAPTPAAAPRPARATPAGRRTALVTGASGGIGEQIARQLAARGTDLVLVARRQDRLQALRVELLLAHPGLAVHVLAVDLSLASAGQEVFAFVRDAGVHVEVLVNNAGVGSHDRLVEEDLEALARQIQLNCGTLVDLTARFLPAMLAADGGKGAGAVVNVASTAAFQPVPTMAVYAAGKAFVLSFTEALWAETRASGVRVVALCPGATDTAFFTATGKEFLTRGRQTPQTVAAAALAALDGRRVVVVPGLANRISSMSYRYMPRGLLTRLSGRLVATA